MEIWQFTSRESADQHKFSLLKNGLLVTKIKCKDAKMGHESLTDQPLGAVCQDPSGKNCFSVIDPFGNPFIASETEHWYQKKYSIFGGIEGVMIGVSDMDKSIEFYKDVVEIDEVIYDKTGVFEDLSALADGDKEYRRVRLQPSNRNSGAFQMFSACFILNCYSP